VWGSEVRTHEHKWGTETVVATESVYVIKRLSLTGGWKTSLHRHARKTQTILVISGSVGIRINGSLNTLEAGDAASIAEGQEHRMYVLSDEADVLLVSNHPGSDDVVKLEPSARMEEKDHAKFVTT